MREATLGVVLSETIPRNLFGTSSGCQSLLRQPWYRPRAWRTSKNCGRWRRACRVSSGSSSRREGDRPPTHPRMTPNGCSGRSAARPAAEPERWAARRGCLAMLPASREVVLRVWLPGRLHKGPSRAARRSECSGRLQIWPIWVGPLCGIWSGLEVSGILMPQPIGEPNRDHWRIDRGDPGRQHEYIPGRRDAESAEAGL